MYIQIQDLANELGINIDRVLRTVSNKRIPLYFELKTISGVSQGVFLEYEKISIELSSLLAIYYLAGESEYHEKQYMKQVCIEGVSYPCTYPLEVVFLDSDGCLVTKNNNCIENKKAMIGVKDENNNKPIPVFGKGLTESIKLNRTIDTRNTSNENEEPIPEKGKKGSLVNWVKWKVENEGRNEAGNIRYGYQATLISEVDKYDYGSSSLKKAWGDAKYSKKDLK